MNVIYKVKHFCVYEVGHEYIVHNLNKVWKDKTDLSKYGHTHIRNKKTAIWICDLAAHRSIPRTDCLYFYQSLIRLSDNDDYTRKLKQMYEKKMEKKNNHQYYINVNKGIKKRSRKKK